MSSSSTLPKLEDFTLDSPSTLPPQFSPGLESMGYEDKEMPSSRGDNLGLSLAAGGLGVMVVYTWILVFSSNPSQLKWFAVHPPLQTFAVALFAFGIITLQPTSLAQPRAKAQGLTRHQIIMFGMGFPIIFIGSIAIIWNKFVNESNHFTTWHGTLGITALVWMILQIALGGGSVWFNGRAFGKNPKAVYKYHRLSGYLLLTLFLLTIHVGGAWSHFSIANANSAMRIIAYAVGPICILIGVWMRARVSKMRFF